MTSQERYSVHAQLEQMQAKYVGTGHADITKLCDPPPCHTSCHLRRLIWARTASLSVLHPRSEWAVNQHRDSCALYVGFNPLSSFFAVAENESIGRVKFSCLQVHGR